MQAQQQQSTLSSLTNNRKPTNTLEVAELVHHFQELIHHSSFQDYLQLQHVHSCTRAFSPQLQCKKSHPCIDLEKADALNSYANAFVQKLLESSGNHPPNPSNSAQFEYMVCSSCWCPLYKYDLNKAPLQQDIQTFCVQWRNTNKCHTPNNIEYILCRACNLLYEAFETMEETRSAVITFFRRDGRLQFDDAGHLIHQPFYFPTVEDVKGLRLPTAEIGNKRQFMLTWLQQKGLVTYPLPSWKHFDWKQEFAIDHKALFNMDFEKSQGADVVTTTNHLPPSEKKTGREAEMSVDSEGAPKYVWENPDNDDSENNNENKQDKVKNKQVQKTDRLIQIHTKRAKVMQNLHYLSAHSEHYISFWIPIDPRPKQKGLFNWDLTRRSVQNDLGKENYLITNQFCTMIEKNFGLPQFFRWATQVFPYHLNQPQTFDDYRNQRFIQYNFELSLKEQDKTNLFNNSLQLPEFEDDAIQSVNEYKQYSHQILASKNKLIELRKIMQEEKNKLMRFESELNALKTEKMLPILSNLQNHVGGEALFKQNGLDVSKSCKVEAVTKLTELTITDQAMVLQNELMQRGVRMDDMAQFYRVTLEVMKALNDKKTLSQYFPVKLTEQTHIELAKAKRPKTEKCAEEKILEMNLRNNWSLYVQRPEPTVPTHMLQRIHDLSHKLHNPTTTSQYNNNNNNNINVLHPQNQQQMTLGTNEIYQTSSNHVNNNNNINMLEDELPDYDEMQ